jgi:DNA-binding Xre family transcriptional regulator
MSSSVVFGACTLKRLVQLCKHKITGETMLTLEEISARLQDRNLCRVSEATGINRNTLGQIKAGKVKNVYLSTILTLSDYLRGE